VIGLSLPETIILHKMLRPQLVATFVGVMDLGDRRLCLQRGALTRAGASGWWDGQGRPPQSPRRARKEATSARPSTIDPPGLLRGPGRAVGRATPGGSTASLPRRMEGSAGSPDPRTANS
jgi:hypothetical protein